jgi:hypothetical protein
MSHGSRTLPPFEFEEAGRIREWRGLALRCDLTRDWIEEKR